MQHNKASEIQIKAEPSMVADICKFNVSQMLLEGKKLNCTSKEKALGSPLLESLFSLGDVQEVLVSENQVIIRKKPDARWDVLARLVGGELRKSLVEAPFLFAKDFPVEQKNNESIPLDSPLALRIQELIAKQINPSIASHGGYITLVDLKEDSLFLKMGGGCQGCGMASHTLKNGVEGMIKKSFPEIKHVIDVTEHEKGTSPFYEAKT